MTAKVTPFIMGTAAFAAQGVQPLFGTNKTARTFKCPGCSLAERTSIQSLPLYRSALFYQFNKLEFMGAKQILDWGTQILLSIRLPEIQIFCTVPLVQSLFHHFHETLTP